MVTVTVAVVVAVVVVVMVVGALLVGAEVRNDTGAFVGAATIVL